MKLLPTTLPEDEKLCLKALFGLELIIVFQRFYLAPEWKKMLLDDG